MDDNAVTYADARSDDVAASGSVAWAPDRALTAALAPYLGREVHAALNAGGVRLLLVGILRQGDSGEYFVHGRPTGTLAYFRAEDVTSVAEQELPTAGGEAVVVIELRILPV